MATNITTVSQAKELVIDPLSAIYADVTILKVSSGTTTLSKGALIDVDDTTGKGGAGSATAPAAVLMEAVSVGAAADVVARCLVHGRVAASQLSNPVAASITLPIRSAARKNGIYIEDI